MSYHNPFTPPRKSATFDDHTLAEIRRAAATGIYDIRGVQSASHPDFEHDRIHARRFEHEQRRKRVEFEECKRLIAARRIDSLERDQQRSVVDFAFGDTNAFVVADQMRRGESANAVAALGEDSRQQCDRRAFTVRAADRDDRTRRALPAERAQRAPQSVQT